MSQLSADPFSSFLTHPLVMGSLAMLLIILLLAVGLRLVNVRLKRGKGQKRISTVIDYLVESAYNFFEDILWSNAPFWIKSYVTNLFLIILIANILGLGLDILISCFPILEHYIQSPTNDLSFTLALAVISIIIVLIVEVKTKGLGNFFYSYVPIFGTNLISLPKWNLPIVLHYGLAIFVKIFDIIISLFIGILNMIGTIAKVISLAFRLYGNMLAGSILLSVIVMMLGDMTTSRANWLELPLLVPLIFYLQAALTAVIQAFVFSLLTSIFIKMSLEEGEKTKKEEIPIPEQLAQSIQREIS